MEEELRPSEKPPERPPLPPPMRPPSRPSSPRGKKPSKPMSSGQKWLVGCGIALGVSLLAVPVIGIIAAIAIPNFMRAKLAANESSAISSLRTIGSAEETFRSARILDADEDERGEYGTLAVLAGIDYTANMGGPVDPPFIDKELGTGHKSGYQFQVYVGESACEGYTGTDASEVDYFAVAWPVTYGTSGKRTFCIDASGIIRGSDIGGSSASCSAVGDSAWPPIGG